MLLSIPNNHITSERSEQSSYKESYMGHPDDIQTALKPLKKLENIEINLYNHLRLAASFKTMNWSGPTATLFDGLCLRKYKR